MPPFPQPGEDDTSPVTISIRSPTKPASASAATTPSVSVRLRAATNLCRGYDWRWRDSLLTGASSLCSLCWGHGGDLPGRGPGVGLRLRQSGYAVIRA
jgi:hypothetical protein